MDSPHTLGRGRPYTTWCAAAGVGACLIGCIAYLVWPSSQRQLGVLGQGSFAPRSAIVPVVGLEIARPVELPVGLLSDYYEHTIEHAPPRDPSGVMQRREMYYLAPRDPFELVEDKLSKRAEDAVLREKVHAWRQAWMLGRGPNRFMARNYHRYAAASISTGLGRNLPKLTKPSGNAR